METSCRWDVVDDSAARDGLGVIDNSVIITLTLDADPSTGGNQALSSVQQTAFLNSLSSNSVVEFGSDAAFGFPPDRRPPSELLQPSTLLLGGGLLGLAGVARFARKKTE